VAGLDFIFADIRNTLKEDPASGKVMGSEDQRFESSWMRQKIQGFQAIFAESPFFT